MVFGSSTLLHKHSPYLANCTGRIESFGANVYTVHDAPTAENAERIIEIRQALRGRRVACVRQKPVCLEQTCRANELVRVPPERGTRSRTAGT